MVRVVGPTAALAGMPAGIQAQGPWVGRRQLFVRFAAEAETATMYTAAALAQELGRLCGRAAHHSLAIAGRDVLGQADFLCAVFEKWAPTLPVMADTDGQRPETVGRLRKHLTLLQVTIEVGGSGDVLLERAMATLGAAAGEGLAHALVLCAGEETSDGQLLRIVEQAHGVSAATMVVLHPALRTMGGGQLDRRWNLLLEQTAGLHDDVRLLLPVPPPAGLR